MELNVTKVKNKLNSITPLEAMGSCGAPDFSIHEWKQSEDDLSKLLKKNYFSQYFKKIKHEAVKKNNVFENNKPINHVLDILRIPELKGVDGDQSVAKIVEAFEHMDPNVALSKLRKIKPSNLEEEFYYSLGLHENLRDFYNKHLKLHCDWIKNKENISQEMENIKIEIDKNDKAQFAYHTKDRGLDKMLSEGLIFRLHEKYVEEICDFQEHQQFIHKPIYEEIKNMQYFYVSCFNGAAKSSLIVHDGIDHFWTCKLAQDIGLFNKYKEMFNAIGDPQSTDMFKREGEIIASISFGTRAFQCSSPGFNNVINLKTIINNIRKQYKEHDDRHSAAIEIINEMKIRDREWCSLEFVFSNYITELDEQRRKYGAIKYKNPTIKGELDPFSLDFLCYFIELHHALIDPKNKYIETIFKFHFIVECYLREQQRGVTPKTITIKLENLDNLRYSDIVPSDVCEWMYRNYGFLTKRDSL